MTTYWSDWRAFCTQSTMMQLESIIEKESEAGRHAEAEIAQAVLDAKHANNNRR